MYHKTMLISFLGDYLRENGFSILEAKGDADTLIAKVAIQQAMNGSSFAVHADDVDIFCMLMRHCKEVLAEVYFQTVMMEIVKLGISEMSIRASSVS